MHSFSEAGRLPKRAAAACLADTRGEGTRAPALLRRSQRQRSRLPPTRHRRGAARLANAQGFPAAVAT
eukprot:1240968-Lingulodinium_polyedra.AAC.1